MVRRDSTDELISNLTIIVYHHSGFVFNGHSMVVVYFKIVRNDIHLKI